MTRWPRRGPLSVATQTLGASGEVLVGNGAADNLAFVMVLLGLVVGLNVTSNAGIVTRTARLALKEEVKVGVAGDGLAVGDAGLSGNTLGLVLTLQALNIDLQVQLAHAGNNSLLALGVNVDAEGRVFALESVHGLGEVVGISGALGLDGE